MSAASPLQRILLTGFMGAGKTTVGILLAERLGWRFIDLDQHVEERSGDSIAGIFARHGEPHFRALETESLASILGAGNIVIALGGGALDSPQNREAVAAAPGTLLVFLDAPLQTLLRRVSNQSEQPDAPIRPLLADPAGVSARHSARMPHYRTAALHVDTSALDPHAVAAQILDSLAVETLRLTQDAS